MSRLGQSVTEEVPYKDNRRGPHDPTENAGEEERAKAHAARASDERPEHPSDREEAGREEGLPP